MSATLNSSVKPYAVGPKQRQGQALRVIVYVMLVLSAGAAVLFGDRLWLAWRSGTLPIWAPLLAPGAFTAFVVVYTADRWLLVRRRQYPLSRALFQVSFALVFLTLLLPQQASELRQARPADVAAPQPALWLLSHDDAHVREATCAVLVGHTPEIVLNRVSQLAHNDPEQSVRTGCEQALIRLHAGAAQ